MKVIKAGRPQTGWATEFECTGKGNGGGGCGAVLLVEAADVYLTENWSYGDSSPDRFYTFKCCGCGVETDMPPKDVSATVRKNAKKEETK